MTEGYDYADVHCHLDDESFDPDRDEVVERAGNVIILCAGQDPKSNRKALALADTYPNVRACLGLHPERVPNLDDEKLEAEMAFVRRVGKEVAAISEVGLDHHWVRDEVQRRRALEIFRAMLEIAESLELPVVVHSRGAAGEVLRETSRLKCPVVLHSFPGSPEEVRAAVSRGHYLSVAPSIYRSKQKQELVEIAPLELLLTESDAPVLGMRKGERNEPSNVSKVVAKIAELKGKGEGCVREALMDNFEKVFRCP